MNNTTTIPLSAVNYKTLPKISAVYIIKNNKNGRVYVGSSKELYTRIMYSKSCLRRGVKFPKEMLSDYKKHGINKFTITYWPVMKEYLSSVEKVTIDINTDYNVYNVYYTDRKRISERSSDAWERISEIRRLRYEEGLKLKEIAARLNASYTTVWRILEATNR
jgi:DNA-binding transcriptional regulator YiaG